VDRVTYSKSDIYLSLTNADPNATIDPNTHANATTDPNTHANTHTNAIADIPNHATTWAIITIYPIDDFDSLYDSLL
jgi:hypothetical protein